MTLRMNGKYLVSLTDETGFTGKYVGNDDGFIKFETTDTNSTINEGGSPYVSVPAYFLVNPNQIVVAKELYDAEECKEYWTVSDNTYDFTKSPTKVVLSPWQKGKIENVKLYDSEEECKEFINKETK